MKTRIAIVNVIAWAGFWAFGYLALSASVEDTGQMITAAILAAIGGGLGIAAYLWLARHSEATGYARPANRASKREDEDDQIHGEVL